MARFQFLLFFQCVIFGIQPYISQALKGNNIRLAKEKEFPFVVSIGDKKHTGPGENSFCTGALITNKLVLTSEHCKDKEALSDIQVTVGSVDVRGGRKYSLAAWTSYDKWSGSGPDPNNDNDIAILTLSEPVTGITLPTLSNEKQKRKLTGKTVIAAGWGVSQSTGGIPRYMETTKLTVMNHPECINKVRELSGNNRVVVPDKYICTNANPPAIIQPGDSGGPIFTEDNVIIGVNDATLPKKLKDNLNVVNAHISIYHYRPFIDAMIAETS